MKDKIWEAAMFAGKYKLDNLINIVDYNKFCIDGPTETIMPLAPLDQKFRDFGWWVKEIDGHNLAEIVDTLDLANRLYGDGKPKCIIAHTVKGHGIPLWEKIHAHVARGDCMDVALKERRRYMAKFNKYVKIGQPAPTYAGAEAAMLKVAQKYDNVCVVLEDIGTLQIDWFKKKCTVPDS